MERQTHTVSATTGATDPSQANESSNSRRAVAVEEYSVEAGRPYIISDCRCVWCANMSLVHELGAARCTNCSRSYPIIDGIPIFTLRPWALLSASVHALGASESRIAVLANASASLSAIESTTKTRAERALLGMRANLALLQSEMTSAYSAAEAHKSESTFLDDIANCSTWPAEEMLPYFYQDWAMTDDFARASSVVLHALQQHRSDSESVAVLGAGACGLARDAAAAFRTAYAVDLSLPTLLVARRVFSGARIVIHVEDAEWRAVELQSAPVTHNIRLMTADAANLPFADNSLSAVVTQYLMDIVGNPQHVAREIRRTLKPGGVWINFSLPPRVHLVPLELGFLTMQELPAFLESSGMRLLETRHEKFTLLNLGKLAAPLTSLVQNVHFFSARKLQGSASVSSEEEVPTARIGLNDDSEWWNNIPRFVAPRPAEISEVTVFSSGSEVRHSNVSFGTFRLHGISAHFPSHPVAERSAGYLRLLLQSIDGRRTAEDLYQIGLSHGLVNHRSDFQELFHYLCDRHGIIEL